MANADVVRPLQRRTAAAGAALLVVAFATGGLLAAALTHQVDADAHAIAWTYGLLGPSPSP